MYVSPGFYIAAGWHFYCDISRQEVVTDENEAHGDDWTVSQPDSALCGARRRDVPGPAGRRPASADTPAPGAAEDGPRDRRGDAQELCAQAPCNLRACIDRDRSHG